MRWMARWGSRESGLKGGGTRMALTLTRRQVPVRGSHIELQSDERTHTGIKVMKSVPKRV